MTLLAITGVFASLFLGVAYYFGSMALTGHRNGHNLLAYALDGLLREEVIRGERGDIRDRNGSIIATQETSFLIFANKNPAWGRVGHVVDYAYTARRLSEVLDLSEAEIYQHLSRDAYNIEFGAPGSQLTVRQRNEILAMELDGIDFRANLRRSYPNGVFASHTVGFARTVDGSDDLIGEMGIEQYFHPILQGTQGAVAFLQDSWGRVQPNRQRVVTQQYTDGHHLYLTLDSGIQLFLEQALDDLWETAEPESLVAIVADPSTGEILAMTSRSSFDPNIREIEMHTNPLISSAFEPGSTMKVFTYAAVIEEGSYVGHQTFQSGSIVPVPGAAPISDWNEGVGWGRMTFDEGFYRSANTAIIKMLQDWITPERTLEYFDAFGFGRPVGLFGNLLQGSQPHEHAGSLPIGGTRIQHYNAAFGQGFYTTPIQHIQAMTAILNGGQMLRPQIISRIVDPNSGDTVFQAAPEPVGQPISANTARQVMDLMVGTVENPIGTAHSNYYNLGETTSGGKTGTAQIFDNETQQYLIGEYLFSYVGFAPADNPRLVMYLAMSRPEYGDGHHQLSQVYHFVMNQSLAYLGMERQERVALADVHELVEIQSVMNLPVARAAEIMEGLGLRPVIIGDRDQIFAQLPEAGTLTVADSKVFLQTERNSALPDFTGWPRSEVNQFRILTGIDIALNGNGFVVDQSVEEGEKLEAGQTLYLTLNRGAHDLPSPDEDNQESDGSLEP